MSDPIRYYDRYAKAVKDEHIYGEGWLRFAYENPVGRFFVWGVARRAFFSRWYGWRMRMGAKKGYEHVSTQLFRLIFWGHDSAPLVIPFIAKYNLDVEEFTKSAFDYKSFNDFFIRTLKPSARPIAPGDDVAVLPADGRHLAIPDVDAAEGFYVKGQRLSLEALLGDAELARAFAGGTMLISRLAPVDYHRYHFPVGGVPGESKLINGWLYSVSPVALKRNLNYLVENKRMVTAIESPRFGRVAMIEVGATNVGSIQQTFLPGRPVKKGDEKGYFGFGGSCVITLFQRGRLRLEPDLQEHSRAGVEVYARMGDRLGSALRAS